MDVIEFAIGLSERGKDGELRRRSHHLLERSLGEALYFVQYAQDMPDELRSEYVDVLLELARNVRSSVRLPVPVEVAEELRRFLASNPDKATDILSKLRIEGD